MALGVLPGTVAVYQEQGPKAVDPQSGVEQQGLPRTALHRGLFESALVFATKRGGNGQGAKAQRRGSPKS